MYRKRFYMNNSHEFRRDPNKSNSELGQHVFENLPHEMYFIDIDGVVYKLANHILRIIEQKQPGQKLKPSQRVILPLLAIAIKYLVENKIVHLESGVFIAETAKPFTTALVKQIGGDFCAVMDKDTFDKFMVGKPIGKIS